MYIEVGFFFCLLQEVKGGLKRMYIDGCRYNERLNTKTEGFKTTLIHWVVWVNIPQESSPETSGQGGGRTGEGYF